MAKSFTQYEKDRVTSKAAGLYNEMKLSLADDTWGSIDPDDLAKRLITMNCHYHGLNELSLKRMPAVLQHEITGIRLKVGGDDAPLPVPLTRALRKPMKVPLPLLIANAKTNKARYDDLFGQVSSGKSINAPFLLPDPAGEMIGPVYHTLLNLHRETVTIATDQSNMATMLRRILPTSKSVRAVCSVFPVIRHFLTPEMAREIDGLDLTKARGDVHSISRAVDMGEMLGLSLKMEAYMRHRVPRD